MTSSFARAFSLMAALCTGSALLPSSLIAQQALAVPLHSTSAVTMQVPGTIVADTTAAVGPRVVRAGVRAPVDGIRSDSAWLQEGRRQVRAGSNVAMMGVGVAAIVVGSLIGGDSGTIIAVGGGVIGLIGLYRYLR